MPRKDAGTKRVEGTSERIHVALRTSDPTEKEILDGIKSELEPGVSQKNALVRWYKKLVGKGE